MIVQVSELVDSLRAAYLTGHEAHVTAHRVYIEVCDRCFLAIACILMLVACTAFCGVFSEQAHECSS